MTITPTTLTRAAGVAAVAAGVIFIGVQINHPHADVTSVTTTEWVVRNSLKVLMAALALAGITGMYLRQVKQIGVLGLIGYLVFGAGYLAHHEHRPRSPRYVLPALADTDPGYVNDVLAAATDGTVQGDIGPLQTVIQVQGFAYLVGGLLFGIALFRARVLARWAAVLLAVGGVVTVSARRAAGRLLPVPGLPERHRHDRPRLLAVAQRADRHRRRRRPRSTVRAWSARRVPNDPAHRLAHPTGATAPAG